VSLIQLVSGRNESQKFTRCRNYVTRNCMLTENEIMLDNFHKILKKHLKDKNLSIVSRELNIPRSVLQDWLHGNRAPSMKNIDAVKRLADYLSMTLDELLLGESGPKTLSSVTFSDDSREYKIKISRIK
jgi:ribosome-binding protein aMBF1 (putative translation factor)